MYDFHIQWRDTFSDWYDIDSVIRPGYYDMTFTHDTWWCDMTFMVHKGLVLSHWWYVADNTFKCIFWYEIVWIPNK